MNSADGVCQRGSFLLISTIQSLISKKVTRQVTFLRLSHPPCKWFPDLAGLVRKNESNHIRVSSEQPTRNLAKLDFQASTPQQPTMRKGATKQSGTGCRRQQAITSNDDRPALSSV
jgi:hypothetical protein